MPGSDGGGGFQRHLVAKLQLVRRQHDDVVVDGQDSLRLDLVVGEEAVTQLVLLGSNHFERDVDLRPKRLCGGRETMDTIKRIRLDRWTDLNDRN